MLRTRLAPFLLGAAFTVSHTSLLAADESFIGMKYEKGQAPNHVYSNSRSTTRATGIENGTRRRTDTSAADSDYKRRRSNALLTTEESVERTQKRLKERRIERSGEEFTAEEQPFTLTVDGIEQDKLIPVRFSYCTTNKRGGTRAGGNISPAIRWTPPPKGTKSLALIVVDKDVPASFDHANLPDTIIKSDEARTNFYHWVVVDISPSVNGIMEGKDSEGIVTGGNPVGRRFYGRVGQNDFSLRRDGPHGGWEGPCPPWNDERLHHYHFTLYALDTPTLKLPDPVTGGQTIAAMQGHVLGQSEVVGTFSTYMPLLVKILKKAQKEKQKEEELDADFDYSEPEDDEAKQDKKRTEKRPAIRKEIFSPSTHTSTPSKHVVAKPEEPSLEELIIQTMKAKAEKKKKKKKKKKR